MGLVVDTNKMTVGITDDYIKKVCDLLEFWDPDCRFFKVNDMQKLVGKLVKLREGAPWIFKLMSHLYISLAYALNSNTKLSEKTSSGFRDLIKQISTKNYSGKPSKHQCHINFAMKTAARMVNRNDHLYLVNLTMQDELLFIANASKLDLGIKFETLIARLISRIPTALIIGDSLLLTCGGYSITLKF